VSVGGGWRVSDLLYLYVDFLVWLLDRNGRAAGVAGRGAGFCGTVLPHFSWLLTVGFVAGLREKEMVG